MKYLVVGLLVLTGVFMFFFFYEITSQTTQGDRFTFCDSVWHEHLYHDGELTDECKDKTDSIYTQRQLEVDNEN